MGNCELSGKPDKMLGGNHAMDKRSIQGRETILLVLHAKDTRINSGWVDHMTAEFLTYQSFRHSD